MEKTLKSLFKAVHKQKLKEIQEILNNPRSSFIDFNSQNSYGETILHVAARTENEEIIRLCLKLGTDPFMKNRKGKIAIELSRKPNIRTLLKQGTIYKTKTYNNQIYLYISPNDKIKRNSFKRFRNKNRRVFEQVHEFRWWLQKKMVCIRTWCNFIF